MSAWSTPVPQVTAWLVLSRSAVRPPRDDPRWSTRTRWSAGRRSSWRVPGPGRRPSGLPSESASGPMFAPTVKAFASAARRADTEVWLGSWSTSRSAGVAGPSPAVSGMSSRSLASPLRVRPTVPSTCAPTTSCGIPACERSNETALSVCATRFQSTSKTIRGDGPGSNPTLERAVLAECCLQGGDQLLQVVGWVRGELVERVCQLGAKAVGVPSGGLLVNAGVNVRLLPLRVHDQTDVRADDDRATLRSSRRRSRAGRSGSTCPWPRRRSRPCRRRWWGRRSGHAGSCRRLGSRCPAVISVASLAVWTPSSWSLDETERLEDLAEELGGVVGVEVERLDRVEAAKCRRDGGRRRGGRPSPATALMAGK